jgi:hypothetical protein
MMRAGAVPNESVEVLIVDDQLALRAVLRDLVTVTPGIVVVAEAYTGEEATGMT